MMRDDLTARFFELLQVAVGSRAALSAPPTAEEWAALLAMSQKQAVVGVCFSGVERLPVEQRPPREVLMQWWAQTRKIEERNRLMNVMTSEVWRYFQDAGFQACVLKGQGNALLYPAALRLRRQSGDVDIWCRQRKADLQASRREVLRWVKKHFPQEEADLKHIHFPLWPEASVEVHFVPTILRDFGANRRLMQWMEDEADGQMANRVMLPVGETPCEVCVPTPAFNLVFQLCHIFDHFLYEGVGLRQVMDYFFVLRSQNEGCTLACSAPRDASPTKNEQRETVALLERFGLLRFAQGLMWVLHEVLGMNEEELLVPMDDARGRLLLEELLAGGNFGQYDSRYWQAGGLLLMRWVQRLRRLSSFVRYYPREVLVTPVFLLYQRIWMAGANKEQ